MNNIPSAEEFFKKVTGCIINHKDVKTAMIQFAKLHCEAQLKAILENVKTIIIEDECPLTGQEFEIRDIDKDSIIKAYNFNNIK
jgi:hypothetical protein